MDVTLLGMSMEVKPEQFWKALLPMDVTLLGITVVEHPRINSLVAVSIMALQLLRESYLLLPFSTMTEVKPEQP